MSRFGEKTLTADLTEGRRRALLDGLDKAGVRLPLLEQFMSSSSGFWPAEIEMAMRLTTDNPWSALSMQYKFWETVHIIRRDPRILVGLNNLVNPPSCPPSGKDSLFCQVLMYYPPDDPNHVVTDYEALKLNFESMAEHLGRLPEPAFLRYMAKGTDVRHLLWPKIKTPKNFKFDEEHVVRNSHVTTMVKREGFWWLTLEMGRKVPSGTRVEMITQCYENVEPIGVELPIIAALHPYWLLMSILDPIKFPHVVTPGILLGEGKKHWCASLNVLKRDRSLTLGHRNVAKEINADTVRVITIHNATPAEDETSTICPRGVRRK